jgi:uncharacterized protein YpiB (UPF0302 family)
VRNRKLFSTNDYKLARYLAKNYKKILIIHFKPEKENHEKSLVLALQNGSSYA